MLGIRLADLLLLFIYLEVIGMAYAYYATHSVPVTLPVLIAITGITRLIILQGKDAEPSKLLFEAGAVLLAVALAILSWASHARPRSTQATIPNTDPASTRPRRTFATGLPHRGGCLSASTSRHEHSPLLPDLTGPDLAIAWAPLEALSGDPHPDEWEDIASAAPNRQKEFAAGRQLARALSDQLGLTPAALRRGGSCPGMAKRSHGQPVALRYALSRRCWQAQRRPVGRCRRRNHRPSGGEALANPVHRERSGLLQLACATDTVALETTLFFSAKESFYKCQYPLTQEWVGFQDVEITRADPHSLAIAPTRGAAQAWHAAPIHTVEISASHVATVMLLRA